MVARRAEIGLIDRSAGELRGKRVAGKHVAERVRLAFDPEAVLDLHVVS